MKKTTLAVCLMLGIVVGAMSLTSCNQNANNSVSEERIAAIEDRLALKNLVDTFSNLADVKDIDTQVLLFTEDAIVESTSANGTSRYQGREELNKAFTSFLNLFDTVYHLNGQQTVDIKGDTATGTAYCQVVLIGKNEKGERTMSTSGVIYNDEYVKIDGRWYIKHRKSNFTWTDVKVVQ